MFYLKIKRVIDFVLSGIGLILLSPVFLSDKLLCLLNLKYGLFDLPMYFTFPSNGQTSE